MTSDQADRLPKDLPRIVGGYRIIRELGPTPVGREMLARRRSTGEIVSLSIVKPEWACLPSYLDRLARDAFAASHVTHPNLVTLFEIGESQGRVFLGSEYVDGPTLAARVADTGPLSPRDAVAHVVQAARGLQALHHQGLAHGEITADALVIAPDGRTRLAGLGQTTPVTLAAEIHRERSAPLPVGNEAQALADSTPFLADLRALGWVLVHLVAGRAPAWTAFDAQGLVALGVPHNLVELVREITHSNPDTTRGVPDAGRLIALLEQRLDGRKPGSNAPTEEQTQALAESLGSFRDAPSARLRALILGWGGVALGSLSALALSLGAYRLASCLIGLGLLFLVARFLIQSLTRGTPLFPKLRGLTFESRVSDWLIGLSALAVVVALLVVLNLHWAWLWLTIFGTFLAVALHLTLDKQTEAERAEALLAARGLIARLRSQGVSEAVVRRFVRTAAGDDWESFYETLFGPDARRAARDPAERSLRGQFGRRRGRFYDLVDPLVEDRLAALGLAHTRGFLQGVAERNLTAQGVNLLTARRKSRRWAEALTAVSADLRERERRPWRQVAAVAESRTVADAFRQAAEAPEEALLEREAGLVGRDPTWILELVFGARVRFVLGSLLLTGFLLWVHQNGIVTGRQLEQIREAAAKAIEAPDHLGALRESKIELGEVAQTEPLRLPGVPAALTRPVRGLHAGLAGLLLIASAFVPGLRIAAFAIPGAALALLGPGLGVPAVGPLPADAVASIAGTAVVAAGAFYNGRR